MPLWTPRIVSSAGTWDLTIPMRPWVRTMPSEGGSEKSTSGARETWLVRRDRQVRLRLRVWESEMTALENFVIAAQTGETWTIQPGGPTGAALSMILESPMPGEEFVPERGEMTGTYEVEIVASLGGNVPWTVVYF